MKPSEAKELMELLDMHLHNMVQEALFEQQHPKYPDGNCDSEPVQLIKMVRAKALEKTRSMLIHFFTRH